MSRDAYFFDKVEDLVSYLEAKLTNPTPLKIQKSLYFLWAFYAATYGSIDYSNENSEFSETIKYPKRLFKANFEAWQYGPVLNKVYGEDKNNSITPSLEKKRYSNSMEKDVWSFIDDMIAQIDPINDFGLVARSHQDSAWKKAYKGIIDKDILDNLDKNKKIEKWKNHYYIENIIVAEENGKIMGYCRYSDEVASKPIAGADSEVMALYVDCEYQRMGIGKALIKEVIEKLKMLNKKSMIIWCLKKNRNARKFYEKIGGKQIQETKYFEIEGRKYEEVGYKYFL